MKEEENGYRIRPGLLLTQSPTSPAERTQEKRRITLIGLDTLFDLWVEHYGKLTDQARRRLPLRPIQFLSPQG